MTVEPQRRIMRVVLPVPLIRAMDDLILKGTGGYATRGEFIVDAIQERVLEMSVGIVEDAGRPPVEVSWIDSTSANQAMPPVPPENDVDQMTAIAAPVAGFVLKPDDDLARPEGRPLFGLHNRDYPSLWALAKIADRTADAAVSIDRVLSEVTQEAWKVGEVLLDVERKSGIKRSALFPTNHEKRKAAEVGFRNFAIGDYRSAADGTFVTSGPLFEWQAIGLVRRSDEHVSVGVTAAGWALLQSVRGASVNEPHPASVAVSFLRHLRNHAIADHDAIIEILGAISAEGANRQVVLESVANSRPDWTENEVSTNSAGYIARAREWGLVEPKQNQAKYHLTPMGIDYANGATE